ncbi:hypothetical protein BC938DRAFT_475286 [Jimgerdemannia flammicorona]|uniref:Uncharacterized protein n=1 Tax=Jimgerdemannia flammicorona TaxID=994334 RepID=A0A433PX07_9FUNG|nr:hypothetical protein BC938DRAFT_475286 [Jimgerdemannia flammicorona]
MFNKTLTMDNPDYKEIIPIAIEFLVIAGEIFTFLSPLLGGQVHRAGVIQLNSGSCLGFYNTNGGLILAGLDTSSIVLLNGIGILTNEPKVQERAFAEIKDNVGLDRLLRDTNEERHSFTRAILIEIVRFRQPLCLGLPHCNNKDEEYESYCIP